MPMLDEELVKKNEVNLSEMLGLDKKEEATPSESQPEEVEEKVESTPSQEGEQTPVEVKEIPFNKHPRFKRMYKELKELRAWREEEQKRAEETPKVEAQPVRNTQIAPEFARLFGDNEEAWLAWQDLRQSERNDIIKEAEARARQILESEKNQAKAQEEATNRIVETVEDTLADLGDEIGLDLSDPNNTVRNQILSICEEFTLFDAQGMPNIEKANELRQRLYPDNSQNDVQEKRQLAARTNQKTNSGTKENEIYTPTMLKEIRKRGGASFLMNS